MSGSDFMWGYLRILFLRQRPITFMVPLSTPEKIRDMAPAARGGSGGNVLGFES